MITNLRNELVIHLTGQPKLVQQNICCRANRLTSNYLRSILLILFIITLSTSMGYAQTLNNFHGTVTSYQNQNLNLDGNTEITITDPVNPMPGSTLNMRSNNVWLYFPNILPSVFNSQQLSHIRINGAAAVLDVNVRIEQYLEGTLVISHPENFNALQVFASANRTGTSMQMRTLTYYRAAQLGALDNNIESFVLKRGYMATFAQNDDGTGFSRVYIADRADVVINQLPNGLSNQVSFVRVFPWRWTAKKGWTSGRDAALALKSKWQYDWDNVATSGLDIEYVPMRHNMGWNAYANINNKVKSTHALGFNEPDRPDQANIAVEAAVTAWPEMLKSGLRVGSPSPSDAAAGLTWLYQFIDRCDALNYRVDFVAVHWYKGGQTARQFYDWLRAIHIRTKRPIWITEWNNGANWTCCKPTYEQQAQAIAQFTHMLDTTSFVERYSLYEWVEDTRQMFYTSPTSLTPAGVVYRDNLTPMAYNPARAYNAEFFNTNGIVSGATYRITARHSGKVLDAAGSANYSNVRQWTSTGATNQQWVVTSVGQGYYRITSVNGGGGLDTGEPNGSNVQVWSYWGGTNQQWQLVPVAGGYFKIVSRVSGRVLDVSGGPGATADGANVIVWNDSGQTNQQWTLTRIGTGTARVAPESSEIMGDAESKRVRVYPNPGNDVITINTEGASSSISVYSLNGQRMLTSTIEGNSTIDISSLPAGMYFITIYDGEKVINEKFIKN